ncbi:Dipeptidyl aminopeptidase BI [Geodia barretti]|uniref:Prolyl endopeptidase n=1 Tax=Geodia barretti TaxID=519541 RepID=A0AA35RL35_GEOBA|nr:Dipeptidyl aminopeptidase BI [Geodia barretti]
MRLATAPGNDPSEECWQPLVDASDEHYIRAFKSFSSFIAVEERIDGLDHVRLIGKSGESIYVQFPESAYTVGLDTNPEFQTDNLRLEYSSMVTPTTVFDYQVESAELEIRGSESATDPQRLRCLGLICTSTATALMASLSAIPPSFSTTRLSLLDRGFIFAIAHIRGGDDLGYHWYEAGKLDRRTNTFNDFVDAARYLVQEGYGSEGHIAIAGGSAGGQLMGAVVNQAPELWGAVAAHVPFVDALNTMLDDTLPLTPIEWPEWGNPIEDKDAFDCIRSYSPYDQLMPRDYPPILVTAGLNDPRVTYWEPAKSGRYDRLYEVAEEYAFMLTSMGLSQ